MSYVRYNRCGSDHYKDACASEYSMVKIIAIEFTQKVKYESSIKINLYFLNVPILYSDVFRQKVSSGNHECNCIGINLYLQATLKNILFKLLIKYMYLNVVNVSIISLQIFILQHYLTTKPKNKTKMTAR